MCAHGAGRKLIGDTKRGAEMQSALLRSAKNSALHLEGHNNTRIYCFHAPIELVCDTHSVIRVVQVIQQEYRSAIALLSLTGGKILGRPVILIPRDRTLCDTPSYKREHSPTIAKDGLGESVRCSRCPLSSRKSLWKLMLTVLKV